MFCNHFAQLKASIVLWRHNVGHFVCLICKLRERRQPLAELKIHGSATGEKFF